MKFSFLRSNSGILICLLTVGLTTVTLFQNCSPGALFDSRSGDTSSALASTAPVENPVATTAPQDGSPAAPFQIWNVTDFKNFATKINDDKKKSNSKNYSTWILMANIDLKGIDGGTLMMPAFRGTLDGNFFTISNFTLDCDKTAIVCGPYVGLFEDTYNATIKNLNFIGFDIRVTKRQSPDYVQYIGGLVGQFSTGSISKVRSQGSILAEGGVNEGQLFGVGGLAGYLNQTSVKMLVAEINLSGNSTPYAVGGLAGKNCNTNIDDSYAIGDIYGGWFVGGLSGACGNGGSTYNVKNSYYLGQLTKLSTTGWGACDYVAPLGTAQGEALSENRTKFSDSFWVGSSSCNVIYSNSLGMSDYAAANTKLKADPLIWKTSATAWPQLLWLDQIKP